MATHRSVIRLVRALKDELTATSVTSRGMHTVLRATRQQPLKAPPQLRAAFLRPRERSTPSRSLAVMVSKHKTDDHLAADNNVQLTFTDTRHEADETNRASVPQQQQEQSQLTISPSCWTRIQQLAQKRNLSLEDVYLRVYVDAGGCSGFTYKFEMDPAPIEANEDVVFEHPTVAHLRVVVDATSLDFIRGSTIDFVEEMIKSSFEVRDNPQSESACGCGSSFALKNFAANPALD